MSNNSIHGTCPDNGRKGPISNKADFYSKVNAILSDTYNSVSFIMILTNTVNYETRRCYHENRQKILYHVISHHQIIQFTSRDENDLIIMYEILNVHGLPCKISGFNS